MGPGEHDLVHAAGDLDNRAGRNQGHLDDSRKGIATGTLEAKAHDQRAEETHSPVPDAFCGAVKEAFIDLAVGMLVHVGGDQVQLSPLHFRLLHFRAEQDQLPAAAKPLFPWHHFGQDQRAVY